MPVDDLSRNQIARKFSLPPPLVNALDGKKLPPGLLESYGLDEKTAKADPAAALTIVAHAVAQSFSQNKSLESALSHVFAGDPHAHASPTSPVGGMVMGILGEAASKVSQGWGSYQPANPEVFGQVARQFTGFLQESRDLGGVVSDASLKAWDQVVRQHAPAPKAPQLPQGNGADAKAPTPKGPTPKDVEQFASEMKGLGIDVNHFMQHFPTFSALRYKMLAAHTSLADYAPVNGMQSHEMLAHVRAQPHSVYPHLTAGQYADMHDMATLHSITSENPRMPEPSEVSRLATSGAKWNEVANFYNPAKAVTPKNLQPTNSPKEENSGVVG